MASLSTRSAASRRRSSCAKVTFWPQPWEWDAGAPAPGERLERWTTGGASEAPGGLDNTMTFPSRQTPLDQDNPAPKDVWDRQKGSASQEGRAAGTSGSIRWTWPASRARGGAGRG